MDRELLGDTHLCQNPPVKYEALSHIRLHL